MRKLYIALTVVCFLLLSLSISNTAQAQKKKKGKKKSPKTTVKIDPNDPNSPIYLGTSGKLMTTGDPRKSGYASEAFRIASGWHPPAIDLQELPKDKFGLIDWVQIFKKEIISPRASLDPNFEDMAPMDLNILFEMKGGYTDNVIFPHFPHTFWLDCTNCHDEIFIPMAGANKVSMPEIAKGEWCGRCHGLVAFPISDCTRCHKYPKGHKVENEPTTSKRVIQE